MYHDVFQALQNLGIQEPSMPLSNSIQTVDKVSFINNVYVIHILLCPYIHRMTHAGLCFGSMVELKAHSASRA